MGNKTRNTSNLVSDNNIFVDISNDRVGIGSTQPTTKLDVVGTIKATSFSGITTAMISDYGSGLAGGYSNTNVDNHINAGTANTGEVLSWNGTDYDWVVGVQTANINADTFNVTGVATFQSSVNLGDNDRLNFSDTNTRIYGANNALNIEASGIHDILIQSNSDGATHGDVEIKTGADGGKVSVVGTGGVGIYHTDTALKLETTADGITVHGDATFNNVSIAGTLTYDDVTNVDSIGLVTARSGVRVTSGGLDVVGVSTFAGNIDANGDLDVDGHTELDNVNVSGVITATTFTGNGGTITNVDAVTAYSADLSTLATIADKVSGKLTYTEFDQISQVDQPAGTPRTVASGDDYDLHAAESYLSKDGKTLFVSRFNYDTQNESNVVTIYERNQSGFNYVGFITETTYANVGAGQTVTHWGPVVTSNSDGSIFAIGSPDGFGGIDARSKLWWLDHVEDDNSQSTGSQQSVHIYQKTGNKIESLGIITASQYGLSSNDLGGFLDSDGEDGFGTSLALSDDGSKLYIGAPHYFRLPTPIDSNSPDFVRGRVYAFDKSGSSYNFVGIITQTRDSTHNGSDNAFGISVACSSDGNKIYIGDSQTGIHTSGHPDAFANNYEEGVVYAYDRSGSNFNCVGIISTRLFPEGNVESFYGNSRFGFDVACSDDGNTIIISAPNIVKSSSTASNGTGGGAIHVVSRDGNTFSSSGRHIHTSADNSGLSVGSFFFGRSIACNSDASKILSGKTNYGSAGVNSFGEVFSFSRSESNLTLSEILTSPRETSGSAVYSSFVTYGSNISIDSTGDTVAIGAPGHVVPGETVTDSGAVFLFSASRQIALHGNQLTNNIGIGTANTNPTSTLDVDGTLKVSGGSTLLDDVNIGTGGTTAFFDVSSGKVGIGTTILTTGAKLSLPTLTGFDGDALFSAGNQLSDYSLWVLNDSANADPSLRQKYVRQFTFNDYTISVGSTKAFRVSNSTGFDSSIVSGPGGASNTDVAFVVNPNTSTELRYNYSKKLETTGYGVSVTGGLNVSGISTFADELHVGYQKEIYFANNNDYNAFQISQNGSVQSLIKNNVTSGNILIATGNAGSGYVQITNASGSETAAKFTPGGATELHYDGTKKLETTSTGVTVTGGITATSGFATTNGTSSQFLKADGSVDSSTYLTSYTESQTLDDVVGLGSDTTQTITVGTATTGVIIRPDGSLNVSGVATASSFNGNLTGIASTATTVAVTVEGTTASAYKIPYLNTTSNSSGNYDLLMESGGLTYQPSNNTLTVTRIALSEISVSNYIGLNDDDQIRIGSSNDARLFYDGTANDFEVTLGPAANKIAITDNGTYKHLITRDGKVGINTSVTPTVELDVNGDVNINGTLNVSGVSTFSGDVNIGTAATTVDLPALRLKGNSDEQNFISNPSISIGGTTAGKWYDTFLVDDPNVQYVRHWANGFHINFSVPDDRLFVVSNIDGASSVSPAGVVDGHIAFKINPETSTELRYNKVKKLETTNTGVVVTGILTATTFSGITTSMISDYGNGLAGGYSDTNVDTHLNTSTASSGEVLSWTGTDYDWVAQSSDINSLSDATTSSTSLLLGDSVSTNSTENTVIGQEAGANINARKNTFVGYQAGKWMTYEQNTAIGNQALGGATGSTSNAYDCVAIGDRALRLIEDNAHFNTAVGAGAGYVVTSGRNNTLIGASAGVAVTTGRDNVCVGVNAGADITSGEDNTCIGTFAGDEITTGSNNIVIGNDAAASSSTVYNEITLGNSDITKFRIPGIGVTLKDNGGTPTQGHVLTVDANGEASFAAASGGGGGASNINGLSDGYSAGLSVGLGTGALANDDGTNNWNVAIGYSALNANTSGVQNVAIGKDAMKISETASANVYIGREAGRAVTTAAQNVVIGDGAGINQTTSSFGVLIGRGAGASLTDAGEQTLIGYYAGGQGSITNSVAIGWNAGSNSDSDKATYIGNRAGYHHDGNQNTFVGYRSGESDTGANVGTGNSNTGIGYYSLNSLTSGSKNTALGHNTGVSITTGSNNILIGYNVDTSSSSASNEVVIGDSNITKFSIPGIGVTLKDNGGTPTQGHVLTVDANGEASFAAASGGGGGVTGSGTFTATAGVAYTANTYTSSDFSNSEYTLFFEHTSGIQSQKVLVMDDETTAYSQEYAIMSSSDLLVSVGATIKSGNVELWVTPESGVSGIITYKFTRETII